LDWLKKGKLWYFAVWVFLMSPLTLALFYTMPEKPKEPQEPAAVIDVQSESPI
jgi:hypothetical protein